MDTEQQAQQSQYASAAGRTERFGAERAAPAAEPSVTVAAPSKLRGIKWRWVIAGAAVVAAAGAGAAAWTYFNSPERIVGQAFGKLAQVKTMHFDLNATTQLKGDFFSLGSGDGQDGGSGFDDRSEDTDKLDTSVSVVPTAKAAEGAEKDSGSPVDVTVGVKGVTDVTDPAQVKTAATLTLAGKVAKVTLLGAGIEVKSIGTTGYVRLSDFTDGAGLGGGELLEPVKGQWIKVSEQDVNEATGGDRKESAEAFTLPDRDKVDRLTAAASKSKLVTFKKLGDDSIDGQPAYHYGYAIDKKQLEAFIPEAGQIVNGKPLSAAEVKETADVFDSIDFKEGEIWIGKKDKLPHKVMLGIKSNSEAFTDIILSLTMSDFDRPVKIEAPQDAKTIEQLEKELYGDGVTVEERDSDGDGHSDEEEVRNGFDPYGPGRARASAR